MKRNIKLQVNIVEPHMILSIKFKLDYYGSLVYVVNDHGLPDQRTVLYVHGGAWFQDPLESHFEYLDLLVDALDARVIMPVYPKIPHRDYRTTFELLTKIYKRLLTKIDKPENLVIIGDSAGGQIALAFAQMLKRATQSTWPYCSYFTGA